MSIIEPPLFHLVDTCSVFWKPYTNVNEPTAFQIVLSVPDIISLASLPLTSLTVQFSNGYPLITLEHETLEDDEDVAVRRLDLGTLLPLEAEEAESPKTFKANLRWKPGSVLVLSGCLSSGAPRSLSVRDMKCPPDSHGQ